MKYDFDTYIPRKDGSSWKWNEMKRLNPDVGEGVIPFSVADMELIPPPELTEGLKEYIDRSVLGYTVPNDAYYQSVVNWLEKRHGWKANPKWITMTAGVVSALYYAVKTVTNPGDSVIIMTPVYYPFYDVIKQNKRNLIRNPLILKERRYFIDFNHLESMAQREDATMLILCSPHNPVGRVWTRDELETVADICIRNGVTVVSDEIHFDLVMPGQKHTVFATLSKEAADCSIVCTAPSKTFNIAGLQTSNIVISNENLRDKFRKGLSSNCFHGVNALGIEACRLVYSHCEPWLDQLITHIDGNRRYVEDFIVKTLPDVKVTPLEGTYLQWLDFRRHYPDHEVLAQKMTFDAMAFFDEGSLFGEGGNGFERINLACPRKVLEEVLGRVSSVIRQRD